MSLNDAAAPIIPIVKGVESEKVEKTVDVYLKYHKEGRTGEPGKDEVREGFFSFLFSK